MGERLQEEAFKKQDDFGETSSASNNLTEDSQCRGLVSNENKMQTSASQTMQLQIHPGLVSKAEDVKNLAWLIPYSGVCPALCLILHLHKTAL